MKIWTEYRIDEIIMKNRTNSNFCKDFGFSDFIKTMSKRLSKKLKN